MAVLKTAFMSGVDGGQSQRSSIRDHALGSSREHSGWRQIWPFLNVFLHFSSERGG